MRIRLFSCLLVAFVAFYAHAAFAAPIRAVIDINGDALDAAALNCANTGSQLLCEGTNFVGNGFRLDSWSFLLDPDPSISGSFSLTNLSGITQTFAVTASLFFGPAIGPSLSATGYVGAGTLNDTGGGGAQLTDAGGIALYTALIDNVPVQTLLDAPQVYTSVPGPFGPGSPVTIPMASFGPTILAQSANSLIGTAFEFTLTNGDQVSLPFGFTVTPAPNPTPTPEPGSLVLLGGGLAGLAVYRRRSK
jgi:hypothetical protein